jgi:protein SCO1
MPTDAAKRWLAAGLLVAVGVGAGALWFVPDVASRLRQSGTYASAPESCRVGAEPCAAVFADGTRVVLTVEPAGLPTETPLTFRVDVHPAGPIPRAVELQGVDMNMGLLRIPLDADGRGSGVIPLCTTDEMRWRADVVLDDRTAGFGFRVSRGHNPSAEPTYPPFRLRAAGGELGLEDLRGRVVAVYFGYTTCPDFCPMTLQTLAAARALLPEDQRDRFVALMVSLDPDRDSPEHLATYTSWFDPAFRGVTGEPDKLAEIAAAWGVAWRRVEQPGSAVGYTLDHDTRAFLVAPDGHMIGFVRHGTPPDALARQVASLL